MADVKIIDESHKISDKCGNGKLRREVWVDEDTRKITRYNLAYINNNSQPASLGLAFKRQYGLHDGVAALFTCAIGPLIVPAL